MSPGNKKSVCIYFLPFPGVWVVTKYDKVLIIYKVSELLVLLLYSSNDHELMYASISLDGNLRNISIFFQRLHICLLEFSQSQDSVSYRAIFTTNGILLVQFLKEPFLL
uniref:Quinol oxidase subunit 1 n=1 Tax=Anthurium amnicola TaxID=1678845 RepID=A0A1D1XP38_9ARAE